MKSEILLPGNFARSAPPPSGLLFLCLVLHVFLLIVVVVELLHCEVVLVHVFFQLSSLFHAPEVRLTITNFKKISVRFKIKFSPCNF